MVAVAIGGRLMIFMLAASGDPAVPTSAEAQAGAPSKEMLLYLAEFEDAEGEWVDPLEVAAPDAAASEDQAADEQPRPPQGANR